MGVGADCVRVLIFPWDPGWALGTLRTLRHTQPGSVAASGHDESITGTQDYQSRKGITTVDSAASVSLRLSGGYSRGSSNGVLNICKPSEMTNIGTVH